MYSVVEELLLPPWTKKRQTGEDYNDTTEDLEQNGYSYNFRNTHTQDHMSLMAKIIGRLTKEVMVVVLGEFFTR